MVNPEEFSDRIDVVAIGRKVIVRVGHAEVDLTPREAQRFAFQLAGAYMRAGDATTGYHRLESE